MFERTQFTTITPLSASITRESVVQILHSHEQMIEFNPLVAQWRAITTALIASTEELPFQWYRIEYGMQGGYTTYDAGFRDLHDGLETKVYAPLGLKIDGKWTLGGDLPGDLEGEALEKGADDEAKPEKGLWLREHVEMECHLFLSWFVKRVMKKSHAELVQRLIARAEKLSAM